MVESVGRLFLAAPVPTEARAELAARLDGLALPGRVIPPENWHITLRFLGYTDSVRFERLITWLAESAREGPFRIRLGGMGAFPRPSRATVLWIGVEQGAERLDHLAAIAEEAAQAAGFAAEDRPFHGHLTLSRIRPPEDVRPLVDGEPLGVSWRADSIVVFRSHLGRGGARYEPLESFPLFPP